MAKDSCADDLARACLQARSELRRASRVLHDEVGSLMAAAGLRLQLARMDRPESAEQLDAVSQVLEGAMERVRSLTRELDPSPVGRTSFKSALLDLARNYQASFEGRIGVRSRT